MQEVSITYCAPCGYEKRAREAAAELVQKLALSPELVPGKGGVFRVAVGDHVVATRSKGYFPSAEQIVEAVRSALAPKSA